MTENRVKEVLERVLRWPSARQADVVHVVELMEEQDTSNLRLSDEQVAEVKRRRAQKSSKRIPADKVFKRFRSRGA